MAYGKPLEKIKVKNQSIKQSVDKGDKKPAEQVVADDNADKVKRPIEGNNGESKAERKARKAEEKRLKDIEVKSK